jgi:hypothetical protein
VLDYLEARALLRRAEYDAVEQRMTVDETR